MKSKLQIIDETAARFNSNNRAIKGRSQCEYCTKDGRKCAVGAYMDETNKPGRYDGFSVLLINSRFLGGIDTVLVPEVRGHEIEFWTDIQKLHDNVDGCPESPNYWDENGLNYDGLEQVKQLKEKWGA